ncbi:MAG: type II toxin-antitoxin system RelE/ParE family toxin [bacterium]|nr:type II toxin-antitoxin system RelE/ParE family toxin [bacterium]
MVPKRIYWMGSSRNDLRSFPRRARRKAGFQLRAVQLGQRPTESEPLPTVGRGVEEIRIRTNGAHRVFYVAKFKDAVYVLHAFQKKTRKTSSRDIEIARQRHGQIVKLRKERDDATTDH